MREKIWEKDDFFEISGKRIDMDPAVVEFGDEVPLVWQFNFDKPPSGKVTEIRLEESGDITGEVEFSGNGAEPFRTKTLEELGCRLGGFYKDVEYNEDGTVVTKAVLKGVSVVVKTNMPGFGADVKNDGQVG